MSSVIRWGILGTGPMAAAFVRSLARVPGARAVAVGSRSAQSAAAFAGRTGLERSFGSYDALLADPNIDVVYIATVNVTHHALCLRALDAGKPVLCEKPFALNAGEARDVVGRARQRGLFCMEAMWTRFLPAVTHLKQLITEGAIGTPRLFSAQIGYAFDVDPTGRQFNPALGGALLDLGVYPVSLAFFLFGPADAVVGRATLGGTGVDETDAIVLSHPHDRLSILAASIATATPNEAVVMGTRGQIRLHDPFFHPNRLTIRTASPITPMAGGRAGRFARLKRSALFRSVYRRLDPLIASLPGRGVRRIVSPFEGEGYQYEAAEVMRCLRAGQLESPIMPLDETIGILDTLDELRRQWSVPSSNKKGTEISSV